MPFGRSNSFKKNELIAYKDKLLRDIEYYDRRLQVLRNNQNKPPCDVYDDSSDSDIDLTLYKPNTFLQDKSCLEQEQDKLTTCLNATQELTGLTMLESEVTILSEDPDFEDPVLKNSLEPGIWREVVAECRLDLVPISIMFLIHQPNRKYAPPSFHNLRVVPVKEAHEIELKNSILETVTTPSEAVEVIKNFSKACRSRRSTIAKLAEAFPTTLFMEPLDDGGYKLKCADLIEISWRLENTVSTVASFQHKFKFDLEYLDPSYLRSIKEAYKQLSNPDLVTDERTLLLAEIIKVCLEARPPTVESGNVPDVEMSAEIQDTEERKKLGEIDNVKKGKGNKKQKTSADKQGQKSKEIEKNNADKNQNNRCQNNIKENAGNDNKKDANDAQKLKETKKKQSSITADSRYNVQNLKVTNTKQGALTEQVVNTIQKSKETKNKQDTHSDEVVNNERKSQEAQDDQQALTDKEVEHAQKLTQAKKKQKKLVDRNEKLIHSNNVQKVGSEINKKQKVVKENGQRSKENQIKKKTKENEIQNIAENQLHTIKLNKNLLTESSEQIPKKDKIEDNQKENLKRKSDDAAKQSAVKKLKKVDRTSIVTKTVENDELQTKNFHTNNTESNINQDGKTTAQKQEVKKSKNVYKATKTKEKVRDTINQTNNEKNKIKKVEGISKSHSEKVIQNNLDNNDKDNTPAESNTVLESHSHNLKNSNSGKNPNNDKKKDKLERNTISNKLSSKPAKSIKNNLPIKQSSKNDGNIDKNATKTLSTAGKLKESKNNNTVARNDNRAVSENNKENFKAAKPTIKNKKLTADIVKKSSTTKTFFNDKIISTNGQLLQKSTFNKRITNIPMKFSKLSIVKRNSAGNIKHGGLSKIPKRKMSPRLKSLRKSLEK